MIKDITKKTTDIGSQEKFVIKVENLSKIYNEGTPEEVKALDEVSFELQAGKMIAIVGPSGSGKSSLLNIIGCMDSASYGSVIIDDISVTDLQERDLADIRKHKIGFIFQDFLLIPTLNALENVLLPLIPDGITKIDKEKALGILDKVGLGERAYHKPKELSGGEKQRVAVARALIQNPPIILADEPTGNLDSKTGDDIIDLLRELNKELGVTVIIVTHDLSVMEKVDEKIELQDGSIPSE